MPESKRPILPPSPVESKRWGASPPTCSSWALRSPGPTLQNKRYVTSATHRLQHADNSLTSFIRRHVGCQLLRAAFKPVMAPASKTPARKPRARRGVLDLGQPTLHQVLGGVAPSSSSTHMEASIPGATPELSAVAGSTVGDGQPASKRRRSDEGGFAQEHDVEGAHGDDHWLRLSPPSPTRHAERAATWAQQDADIAREAASDLSSAVIIAPTFRCIAEPAPHAATTEAADDRQGSATVGEASAVITAQTLGCGIAEPAPHAATPEADGDRAGSATASEAAPDVDVPSAVMAAPTLGCDIIAEPAPHAAAPDADGYRAGSATAGEAASDVPSVVMAAPTLGCDSIAEPAPRAAAPDADGDRAGSATAGEAASGAPTSAEPAPHVETPGAGGDRQDSAAAGDAASPTLGCDVAEPAPHAATSGADGNRDMLDDIFGDPDDTDELQNSIEQELDIDDLDMLEVDLDAGAIGLPPKHTRVAEAGALLGHRATATAVLTVRTSSVPEAWRPHPGICVLEASSVLSPCVSRVWGLSSGPRASGYPTQ